MITFLKIYTYKKFRKWNYNAIILSCPNILTIKLKLGQMVNNNLISSKLLKYRFVYQPWGVEAHKQTSNNTFFFLSNLQRTPKNAREPAASSQLHTISFVNLQKTASDQEEERKNCLVTPKSASRRHETEPFSFRLV